MDAERRLRGRRMLALPVILMILLSILVLALYESEGKKSQALNMVTVAVSSPLTREQEAFLRRRLQEYASDDNRAPVTLKVYVVDPTYEADLKQVGQEMNTDVPNLYMIEDTLRLGLAQYVSLEPLSSKYLDDPSIIDDVFYSLERKTFLESPEIQGLPPLFIALQRSDSYAVTKDAQTQSYYVYQSQLLDNIAGEAPGEPI